MCILHLPSRAALLAALLATTAAHAQVTPDGGSATTVTVDGAGKATVGVAPANASGISHNTYESFSVSGAGVDLDNRGAFARTILNEVTSTNRSVLEGALSVLGPRAHVIIANPNGITVDGASFVNTGGVSLGAGATSLVAAGSGENVRIDATGGDILIEGAGVTGSMTTLQLLAGRLRIDGPVTNSNPASAANISIAAGNASAEFDSTVIPGSTLSPWATVNAETGTQNAVVVDVTPRGSLTASRIALTVSGDGAGVSYAGDGRANLGDFRIDASGQVVMRGADIQADDHVRVAAAAIDILNDPVRQGRVEATTGAVTLLASAGDIRVHGTHVIGAARDGGDAASLGGVTLDAAGNIELLSIAADRLAILFASSDDLSMTAAGDVVNNTGRLLANGQVSIVAGGDFLNAIDVTGGSSNAEEWFRSDASLLDMLLLTRRKEYGYTIDYGAIRLPEQLAYVVGFGVDITARSVLNRGGEINANSGPVTIDAATVRNEAVLAGAAHYVRRCRLFCSATGSSDVALYGGNINASGSIIINATDGVHNIGGQMLSFGDIHIDASRVVTQGVGIPVVVKRPPLLTTLFGNTQSWLYFQTSGGLISAPIGAVRINADTRVTVDAGEIVWGTASFIPNGLDQVATAEARDPWGRVPTGIFNGLLD